MMEYRIILQPYRVVRKSTHFHDDFWVLSQVEERLLLETAHGTYIVPALALALALKSGAVVIPHS